MENKRTWADIYKELSADMPTEAIERSKGSETGKGYDTTGFGYQYIVNRFNDVMGVEGWDCEYKILDTATGTTSGGKNRVSITVETTISITFEEKTIKKTCVGGHVSGIYADALKGAFTNSLKKTAGLFGVGKAAYEGSVDDDNVPDDEPKTDANFQHNKKVATDNKDPYSKPPF